MKKLVKTAKQQFEERLKEFTLMTSYQGVKDERFYLCENDHKEMSILRDSKEDGFIEYKYQGSYQSMIDSEEFLYEMVCRFNEIGEPVKNIFDWYASADKDLTPFTVYDIWQRMGYLTRLAFEDIYEEVTDVRIITAKEQWEKDSRDAELCCNLDNGTIWKVLNKKDRLSFFRSNDHDGFYHRYDLPNLDELRKDAAFISDYLSLVQDMHPEDLGSAVTWIKRGIYEMSACSMMDLYQASKTQGSYEYEDKEIEPIEKHDFSSEIIDLKERMVEHIKELCEQDMTVNVDSLTKRIALGWEDNSFVYTEDIKDMFVKKSGNGDWIFCYTSYSNGRSDEYPFKYLSIETLQMFIEAMR